MNVNAVTYNPPEQRARGTDSCSGSFFKVELQESGLFLNCADGSFRSAVALPVVARSSFDYRLALPQPGHLGEDILERVVSVGSQDHWTVVAKFSKALLYHSDGTWSLTCPVLGNHGLLHSGSFARENQEWYLCVAYPTTEESVVEVNLRHLTLCLVVYVLGATSSVWVGCRFRRHTRGAPTFRRSVRDVVFFDLSDRWPPVRAVVHCLGNEFWTGLGIRVVRMKS